MRALIGMVQALETPGNCSDLSISAMSLSTVMPGRHSSSGFKLITVSIISVGAGSVAVEARPALPKTDSTSGKDFIILSCVCRSSAALVTEMPGSVTGIYKRVPSLRLGMNSLPSFEAGQRLTPRTTSARRMVAALNFSASRITGR